MRQNALRQAWADGRRTSNGWLSIPSSFAAEVMAHQGWDSLTIDLQHGVVDYQTAVGMLQAISTTAAVPMVRVPWLDPGIVMKMLDAGSYGVICPMINNARRGGDASSAPAATRRAATAAWARSAPRSTPAKTMRGTPTTPCSRSR